MLHTVARRIDPRREHAVFEQWDRASRDSTHPECQTARALILHWLTWTSPITRRPPNMPETASAPHPAVELAPLVGSLPQFDPAHPRRGSPKIFEHAC